jgi:hypothetical protein
MAETMTMTSPKTPTTARKVRDTVHSLILYAKLLTIEQSITGKTPAKSRSKSTPGSGPKRKMQAQAASSAGSPAKGKKRKIKDEVSLESRKKMAESPLIGVQKISPKNATSKGKSGAAAIAAPVSPEKLQNSDENEHEVGLTFPAQQYLFPFREGSGDCPLQPHV